MWSLRNNDQNFKKLNDRYIDLYEYRDSLKDKLKTLSALLVDKGKNQLTSLVKDKTFNSCELEIRENITFFFTHTELSNLPHYSRLIIKAYLAKMQNDKMEFI